MQWNISVSGQKKDIESLLDAEVAKYEAVNFYDGHLLTIKPAMLDMIKGFVDTDTISVTASGGDQAMSGVHFTHTISVSVT